MTTPHRLPRATLAEPRLAVGAQPVRVVIVDDCAEVRFLLATVIELDGRFEVVAEASDPVTALAAVAAAEPDVVLVDLRLGRRCGTSIIRALRQRGAPCCIVVVTASTAPHDHAAAFAAGADAVQVKGSMISTMVDELGELMAGRRVATHGTVGRDGERTAPDHNACPTEGRSPRGRVAIGR